MHIFQCDVITSWSSRENEILYEKNKKFNINFHIMYLLENAHKHPILV